MRAVDNCTVLCVPFTQLCHSSFAVAAVVMLERQRAKEKQLDRRAFGPSTDTFCVILVDSQDGVLLSALATSTPVNVDEMSWYVMKWLYTVSCLTVAVPLYHTLQQRSLPNVLDYSVYKIPVVRMLVGFFRVLLDHGPSSVVSCFSSSGLS